MVINSNVLKLFLISEALREQIFRYINFDLCSITNEFVTLIHNNIEMNLKNILLEIAFHGFVTYLCIRLRNYLCIFGGPESPNLLQKQ